MQDQIRKAIQDRKDAIKDNIFKGIYKDNPANRKSGLVGKKYGGGHDNKTLRPSSGRDKPKEQPKKMSHADKLIEAGNWAAKNVDVSTQDRIEGVMDKIAKKMKVMRNDSVNRGDKEMAEYDGLRETLGKLGGSFRKRWGIYNVSSGAMQKRISREIDSSYSDQD